MKSSNLTDNDLVKMIEHENQHWSKIFKNESKNKNSKLYSSFWWEDYFSQIVREVSSVIPIRSKIIEFGSGSGKATLLLDEAHSKHLFDISTYALDCARARPAERWISKNP